jgi:adenine-specific DNA methylase
LNLILFSLINFVKKAILDAQKHLDKNQIFDFITTHFYSNYYADQSKQKFGDFIPILKECGVTIDLIDNMDNSDIIRNSNALLICLFFDLIETTIDSKQIHGFATALENLEKVKKALKNTIISRNDFEIILNKARRGDLVYLDPPYVTGHSNNGFIEYNSKIFSWHDQKRLRKVVGILHKKGCKIIMSNASHVVIRNLYKGFKLHSVKRHSHIAGIVKNIKSAVNN